MGLTHVDEMTIATEEDKQLPEIWEVTIPGRVSLLVHVPGGQVRDISAAGEGQRLRLSAYDRKVAQEQVLDPNNDPFTNGMLVRVDLAGAKAPKPLNEMDDKALADVFLLDDEDFTSFIDTLSEVNLRRLKAMTRKAKAKTVQAEALDEMIAAKFPLGGDTPSNKEARGE